LIKPAPQVAKSEGRIGSGSVSRKSFPAHGPQPRVKGFRPENPAPDKDRAPMAGTSATRAAYTGAQTERRAPIRPRAESEMALLI